MKHALENQLVGLCLEPFGEDAEKLITLFGDEEINALAMSLACLLQEESMLNNGLVECSIIDIDRNDGFKSILSIDRAQNANRIVSFSLKDAAADTCLPIVGIAAALYLTPLSLLLVPKAADLLKKLWNKVVFLERPKDGDCIDIVEAILRADIHRHIDKTDDRHTTERLRASTGLSLDAFDRAIQRLYEKKIVEAVVWGGQADDFTDNGNTWRIKL